MTPGSEAGVSKELESLRAEVEQLREIVAALVDIVVESHTDGTGELDEDLNEALVPEVGTGSRFGWGM